MVSKLPYWRDIEFAAEFVESSLNVGELSIPPIEKLFVSSFGQGFLYGVDGIFNRPKIASS